MMNWTGRYLEEEQDKHQKRGEIFNRYAAVESHLLSFSSLELFLAINNIHLALT